MTNWQRIIRELPTRIPGLITVTIGLLSVFGILNFTPEQTDAIIVAVGAWLTFAGFIVTPTNDPVLPAGKSVRLPDGTSGIVVKD